MRWPFSFGRSSTVSPAAAAPRPHREWASLPAIQRTLGEPALTAPTATFVESLAGTRDPGLSLQPLGHHVSVEAPSGLVTGVARPINTYAPSSQLVGRPRPRAEARVQRWPSDVEPAPPADVDGEDTGGELATDAAPLRHVRSVLDAPAPPAAPLTRLAEREADAVLRLALPRPPAPNHGGGQPDGGSRAAAPAEIAAPAVTAQPLTAQRLTLGQSRRLGLGAPLPHTPASNAEPGPPGPALLQLAPSPRPPRREIDGLAGMGNPPMEADAIQPAAAAAVELPARLADGVDAKVATSSHRAAEPVAQRALSGSAAAASTSAQPVLQRAVARPLPPSLPLPPMAPAAPTIGARPGLLTVRRPAGEPAALASEAAVESPWRRLSAVTTSAPPAEPAAGSRAERSFEGNPRANSPLGAIAAAPSVQALSYRAPVVQRASGAPQDFVALSPFVTPSTGSSSTQRAVAVDEPAVQREVAAGEAPDLGPGIAAGPAAETAASVGGVAAAAAGQSEKDLDDLARKLHDRITQQLRRDLLIQRERAGLVTDLR